MNSLNLMGLIGGILIGIYTFYLLVRISKAITNKYKLWAILLCLIPAGLMGYATSNMWSKYLLIMAHVVAFSILCNILYVIYLLIIKKAKKEKSIIIYRLHVSLVMPILITVGVMIFGIIKMNNVVETNYSFNSTKIEGSYKFALISDTHYATIQNTNFVNEKVEVLNKMDLDFVILDGDIVEENTTKEMMKEVFYKFSFLKTKYGIYYVYGNHDSQPYRARTFTNAELEDAITKNGITILKDQDIIINNEILLIGRDDNRRNNKRKKIVDIIDGKNISDYYTIVADHQPLEFEENSKLGVDLEVSGHTHGGQIWPVGFFMEILGRYPYGNYKLNNSNLVVTSGFTGWGYPIRTQGLCEYVIININ